MAYHDCYSNKKRFEKAGEKLEVFKGVVEEA